MERREFIGLYLGGGAALVASRRVFAQTASKIWHLGVLSPIETPLIRSTLLPELTRRGFVEGRSLVVDIRIGSEERLPQLARELVATKPDVILAVSDWAVIPAREATKSTPIVAYPMGADPVAVGIAESWARPGGNVTGVTVIAPELEVKRLELLREIVPAARRIAMLSMHRKVTEPGEAPLRAAAESSGIQLTELYIDGPEEFRKAFAAMRTARAEALVIVPVPEFSVHAESLAKFALQGGLPTVCGGLKAAAEGCLLQYGPDPVELSRLAADYVARIFAGASPEELPIQGPTRYAFAVNLKTAKALGLIVPQSILARADEVIE